MSRKSPVIGSFLAPVGDRIAPPKQVNPAARESPGSMAPRTGRFEMPEALYATSPSVCKDGAA